MFNAIIHVLHAVTLLLVQAVIAYITGYIIIQQINVNVQQLDIMTTEFLQFVNFVMSNVILA